MKFRSACTRTTLAATTALLVSACTVAGNPIPQIPDLTRLNVTPFGIDPLEPAPGSAEYGRVVESMRMAEALIFPTEADDALRFQVGGSRAVPLPTPVKAAGFLADPVRAVLERNGMLAGFVVTRGDREQLDFRQPAGAARMLAVMLLRFPDAATAERSAQEMNAADAVVSAENVPVEIPGYPAAQSHWRPTVPSLAATIAHGSFVVHVLAGHTATDLTALTGLTQRAFAAQLPRLDSFAATPADQIAALPLDSAEVLRRIVPDRPGEWPHPAVMLVDREKNAGWDTAFRASGVVYGPRALRLWSISMESDAEAMAVSGNSYLLRYSSIAAARSAYSKNRARGPAEGSKEIPAPSGVPDTWCTEQLTDTVGSSTRFTCQVHYGRYRAAVNSVDRELTQRMAAAQYALLVRSDR